MNAAIISIGDELVLGQTVDTNAPWLAARLTEYGVLCPLHIVVPDDQAAIVRALRLTCETASLVIVTGGLGPTDDDLTRPALAELLSVELVEDVPSVAHIESFFRERGRDMPPRNRLQAQHPRGTMVLDNPVGTAPGILAQLAETTIVCVPGVPSEMRELFDRHVAAVVQAKTEDRAIATASLQTFGTGESVIADLLGDLMDRSRNPTVGTTVSRGIITVRVRSVSSTRHDAQRILDATLAEVRQRLGQFVFGSGEQSLADAVGSLLLRCDATIVTAESCTGGLLGKMLTDVAGSSRYYVGGFVTYSNEAKVRDLNVSDSLIRDHGAVSEPVARAMAQGALERTSAHYALSITGIAGPDGGTAEKPVGTIWIALAHRGAHTICEHHHIPADRATVRDRAAKTALNMLRLAMT